MDFKKFKLAVQKQFKVMFWSPFKAEDLRRGARLYQRRR